MFTELGWWVWIRVPELGFRFRTCLYAAANIRKRKEREKGTPLDVALSRIKVNFFVIALAN